MIKDADGVCRYIDSLIHRYLVESFTMYFNDIYLRPSTDNFYVFPTCSNPRRVTLTYLSPAHNTVSILLTSLIYLSSQLLPLSTVSISSLLPVPVVPSNNIIWLSFDSVLHLFGSQLTSWSDGIVQ